MAMQARVLHAAGNSETALSVVMMGLSIAERGDQHFWTPELMRLRGELLVSAAASSGELQQAAVQGEAERCFRSALSAAADRGARTQQLRAATSLARLWQCQGKSDAARDLLAPVYQWFTEGFDTGDLKEAKALLAAL